MVPKGAKKGFSKTAEETRLRIERNSGETRVWGIFEKPRYPKKGLSGSRQFLLAIENVDGIAELVSVVLADLTTANEGLEVGVGVCGRVELAG